ncbi:MAG: hypothetical protein GF311_08610 [Candidatus Lokiarchaeota archaeon]|nr:hypothetical protein [Candidatus Lokiarchaeota archaeon]
MSKIYIIVDGSNVAFSYRNSKKEAKIENINIIIEILKELSNNYNLEFRVIIDASLRHRIDKKEELEELEKIGLIIQTPRNHQADEFIIEFAKRHPENTIIISNDAFGEYDSKGLIICNFLVFFSEIIIRPDPINILGDKAILKKGRKTNVCKV